MGEKVPLPPPIPDVQATASVFNADEFYSYTQETDLSTINMAGEEETVRLLIKDQLGRSALKKLNSRQPIGYIILTYPCRAMEWVNLRQIFSECLTNFDLVHLVPALQDVRFAWKYHDNMATVLYKPAEVFKKFSFVHLLDETNVCMCLRAKRFKSFLDVQTSHELCSAVPSQPHVRTVDTNLIQNRELRQAVAQGLNHIPVKPTKLAVSVATTIDAFMQLVRILRLESEGLDIANATEWIRSSALARLKLAAKENKAGLRFSGLDLLQQKEIKDEIAWLSSHLYCAGLDKASNNACFICIKHIRLLALERLSGPDFLPCKDKHIWLLPSMILDKVTVEMSTLIPQISISFQALPYLMATYKLHKNKYRWLTNAFHTVYSNLAQLLTLATMAVLEKVKDWTNVTVQGYRNFLQCHTSMFWMINSSIEAALNLPEQIYDIFVADITRCYESIPLHGQDNLVDAIAHILQLGFRQAKSEHPLSDPKIWIRTDNEGKAVKAIWSNKAPTYGSWFPLTEKQLIELHRWLINNCFIALGDRVWQQKLGIPMGFSCSPLWCNTYLLHYEINFIQRLARLGRKDLLQKFHHAFRYIDDLCWLNTSTPRDFLSPHQERDKDNPFWIYPLDVLEIKCEVTRYSDTNPSKGIQASFMNMEIHISDEVTGTYRTCKYDKRRTLPFSYSQYIRFHSNRPIKQTYSIAVSQTVPILYVSSSVDAALKEIRLLIHTLKGNGFYEPRLLKNILQFLSTNSFPGVKFDIQQLITTLR